MTDICPVCLADKENGKCNNCLRRTSLSLNEEMFLVSA